MTGRTVTSLALGLIVILALYSTADAQTLPYVADTGVIDLAPGQVLRITATGLGYESIRVQFKKMEYVESEITDGVVRKQVGSQTTSGPIILSGDQCLVFYAVASGAGVRIQLLSSSQNLKANAFVVSPASGGSNGSSVMPMEQISFNFTNITVER
jgi:hypothetical protein